MSLKGENKVRKVVDEYLGKGLIHPSFLPFALLPVLLVRKKDGPFKMCVDYWVLYKNYCKATIPHAKD